jgi:hypothetical protein
MNITLLAEQMCTLVEVRAFEQQNYIGGMRRRGHSVWGRGSPPGFGIGVGDRPVNDRTILRLYAILYRETNANS